MVFINIILQFENKRPLQDIQIEANRVLHELEIYEILYKMFPAYIDVNFNDETNQAGYSWKYKNGLNSVTTYINKGSE